MSRNHDGMTHYVGDDCPGGHQEPVDAKDQRIAELAGRLADVREAVGMDEADDDMLLLSAVQNVVAKLAAAEQRIAEAERERDLAIAHDRQPYPTAEAYERVCAANEAKRLQVRALSARVEEAKAIMRDLDLDTEKDAMRAGIGFGVWKRLRAFLASPAVLAVLNAPVAQESRSAEWRTHGQAEAVAEPPTSRAGDTAGNPDSSAASGRDPGSIPGGGIAVLAVAGSGEVEKPTCRACALRYAPGWFCAECGKPITHAAPALSPEPPQAPAVAGEEEK